MKRAAPTGIRAQVLGFVELGGPFGLDAQTFFLRGRFYAYGLCAVAGRALFRLGQDLQPHGVALGILFRLDQLDSLVAVGDLDIADRVNPFARLGGGGNRFLGKGLNFRAFLGFLR